MLGVVANCTSANLVWPLKPHRVFEKPRPVTVHLYKRLCTSRDVPRIHNNGSTPSLLHTLTTLIRCKYWFHLHRTVDIILSRRISVQNFTFQICVFHLNIIVSLFSFPLSGYTNKILSTVLIFNSAFRVTPV